MTPKNHGRQVWDRIAAGEFYMITDSFRPYVEHDFPYEGKEMAASRVAAITQPDFGRKIDNRGALGPYRAAFVGKMMEETARRGRARAQAKL